MLGRAITLYCDLIARAAIDGIERAQGAVGADLGAAEEPIAEAGLQNGDAPRLKRPCKLKDAERRPRKKAARGEGKDRWQGPRPGVRSLPASPKPAVSEEQGATGDATETKDCRGGERLTRMRRLLRPTRQRRKKASETASTRYHATDGAIEADLMATISATHGEGAAR